MDLTRTELPMLWSSMVYFYKSFFVNKKSGVTAGVLFLLCVKGMYVLVKSPSRGMLPVYKPDTQGRVAPEGEGL